MNYIHIAIPDTLVKQIEELIKNRPELGYRNRSEFVIDLIRREIQKL